MATKKNNKRLWWVTRPVRDLNDIEKSLKYFAKLSVGKQWQGNKELQKSFELNNPAKTNNVGEFGANGSGGRTWAAWLRMWGMWYNPDHVTLTNAGNLICTSNDITEKQNQIINQIMNFQIDSAYHRFALIRNGDWKNFSIFPFRFIIKLLLDNRIKYLDMYEIAIFLLQVKNGSEFETVVHQIKNWRNKLLNLNNNQIKEIIREHVVLHKIEYGSNDKIFNNYFIEIKDISNTLMVNISYLPHISYELRRSNTGVGVISIKQNKINEMIELLKKHEEKRKFMDLNNMSEETFVRKFGIRFDRSKVSNKKTIPMSRQVKRKQRIIEAIEHITKTDVNLSQLELIAKVQKYVNDDDSSLISKIVSEEIKLTIPHDTFLTNYIECGKDGNRHVEFEKLTRLMLTKMGFETNKQKIQQDYSGKPEIDGLILNFKTNTSGLLECKSGNTYTFTIGDCEKMKNRYINNFRTFKIKDVTYNLDFFIYVIGKNSTGIDNFKNIIKESKISGTIIYAHDLAKLYQIWQNKKISNYAIWKLFQRNKELMLMDIDEACDY